MRQLTNPAIVRGLTKYKLISSIVFIIRAVELIFPVYGVSTKMMREYFSP